MTAPRPEMAATIAPARVVSVSPADAADADDPLGVGGAATAATASTPPLIDATSANAGRDGATADLVAQAGHAAQQLIAALDQARAGDDSARQATRHLQDRLRVSARMLQALQSQLNRIEAAVAELKEQRRLAETAVRDERERLEQQAAAFDARIDQAVGQFQNRLEQAQQHAHSQAVEQLANHAQRMDAIDKRIGELTSAADVAAGVVEHGEQSLLPVAHHAAVLKRVLDERLDGVEDILDRLRPWEPLLLDGPHDSANGDNLPAPLRELIGEVRACLAGDAADIAASLHAVADRLARLGGDTATSANRSLTEPDGEYG